MRHILRSSLVVFVLFITLASCSKDEPIPTPPIVYDQAELVTRNYLTTDDAFDWYIDGEKVGSDLAYSFGEVSAAPTAE